MKILFFWMEKCPHCIEIKEELKDVPSYKKFISIEKQHVTDVHRNKYGIKSYPTIIFLSDKNAVLGKLVGVHTASEINNAVDGYKRTEKIINKL